MPSGSSKFKSVDIMFALMLFSVFVMAVLMVLLSGGRVYKDTVEDISARYEGRTSIAYLTTKLRRCDAVEGVRVGEFAGAQALFLSEYGEDGRQYETIIYEHEGSLKEQNVEKGISFSPGAGLTILEVKSVSFSVKGGDTVLIEYETANGAFTAFVHLRVKGAVVS
ncbi:MAG: DUF4860 domain-containing protein [Oscillospiraceae bacterium]|nr:DUF4860 domain-containing protein [Oscillospiraceae bacterium]